jgi:hypothetical protein
MKREARACQFCDQLTEIVLGGVPVCEACYQEASSCCAEFGGQDVWQQRTRDATDEPRPSGQGGPA